MEKREILTMVQFNFWANNRILEQSEQLSFEDLRKPLVPDPGWGNILGILVHILDAEYGWRSVLQSESANEILKPDDFEDIEKLRFRWEAERTAWFDYLARLKWERKDQPYGADPQDGMKVWQTIVHVVTHGVQHRSEAAAILTWYGFSPGELDFDVFLQDE